MNVDKTDISNTNRPRNQTPGTTLPEEYPKKSNWKANLLEIYMLKSKDLLEKTEDQRYQRNHNVSGKDAAGAGRRFLSTSWRVSLLI